MPNFFSFEELNFSGLNIVINKVKINKLIRVLKNKPVLKKKN